MNEVNLKEAIHSLNDNILVYGMKKIKKKSKLIQKISVLNGTVV